jgi:1-acyl-sn-glycerol-3-phosphate acyltransferase
VIVPPRWIRLVVGPLVVFGVWLTIVVSLPLTFIAALIVSHWLPGNWRGLRLLGFALVGLTVECGLLVAAFGLWIASGFGWRLRSPAFERAHYACLRVGLRILVVSAQKLFRLELETDGVSWSPLDDGVPGSTNAMLVLARHAGPGDSLLLMDTLLNRDHQRQPRTVLKYTMQLDPVVDVYLHRLPAEFVDPNPASGHDVTESIAAMSRGMGPEDAVLIFPEGGNFTPRRRIRAIAKLRDRGFPEHAQEAEQMTHVLPPRPGGVLAAIDAAPYADVVFVAHTGLEQLSTIRDIWRGIPQQKTLHLRWWFVPAADVPTEHEARIDWLFDRWSEIDTWIGTHPTRAADEL